jgi:Fe-S-cluster containining protein
MVDLSPRRKTLHDRFKRSSAQSYIGSTPPDTRSICIECGAHCCRDGGAVATNEEVLAILNAGYPDYFEVVSEDVRITSWQENGDCPYLHDNTCSVYEVRPLRCRAYPILQIASGEVFLSLCPLGQHLSHSEMRGYVRLLMQCPRSFVDDAARHLQVHSQALEKKLRRFKTRPVSSLKSSSSFHTHEYGKGKNA